MGKKSPSRNLMDDTLTDDGLEVLHFELSTITFTGGRRMFFFDKAGVAQLVRAHGS